MTTGSSDDAALPAAPRDGGGGPPRPEGPGGEGSAEALGRARSRVSDLEEEVSRLRRILRQARDIIVCTDLEGRVTEFNEEAEAVLGYTQDEVVGGSADLFYVHKRQRTELLEELASSPTGVTRADVQVRTKSGKRRWLGLSLAWLRDSAGAPIGTVGVSKDITQRRRLEEELRRLSVTDKLTGLFNQSHFFHRLEVEKERAVRLEHDLALLLFDLDGFKELNDEQGHGAGDECLRTIGAILFRSVRKEVDSAFRYGGDEFTVLLPGADKDLAVHFAERVRTEIRAAEAGVRASMGICGFDPANRGLQIVEKADEAMYVAKRAGGDRVAVYAPDREDTVLVGS